MYRVVTLTASLIPLSVFAYLILGGTPVVLAQNPTYTPLVGLPGISGNGTQSLAEYFNQLYLLTIVVGCFIAVIKITMAGVKWALSDVVTDKSSAREDIKGALLGLAILLVPFVVLNTINPNLTNLNILRNAGSVKPNMNTTSTGSGDVVTDAINNASKDIKSGEVVKNCNYRNESVPTGQTDVQGEPVYTTIYYSDTCLTDCAGRSGTFKETSERGGTCTYLETYTPDPVVSP